MKEQMKETIIVKSFNLLQDLKKIVEKQQLQIDALVNNNVMLEQKVKTLEKLANIFYIDSND